MLEEMEHIGKRLDDLERELANSAGVKAARYDRIGKRSTGQTSDPTRDAAMKREELQQRHNVLFMKLLDMEPQALELIDSVSLSGRDTLTRRSDMHTLVYYHYIGRHTWKETTDHINEYNHGSGRRAIKAAQCPRQRIQTTARPVAGSVMPVSVRRV